MVLKNLFDNNYIDKEEYSQLIQKEIILKKRKKILLEDTRYYVEEIRKKVVNQFGFDRVYKQGFNVKTPINLKLQKIATNALRKGLEDYDRRKGWRGPLTNRKNSKNWKKNLNEESLVLKNIGELSYNADENIVFVPDLDSNHFLGSFGLPTIYYKKKLTTEYTYNKSTLKKYNDLKPNNPEYKVPEFIKYAAAMVLIISATFFFNNEYEKYTFQQKILLEQENRQRTIERVENAIFDFGSIPAIELKVKLKSNKYHIIAGAFGVKSNADKLYKNLLTKGYNPTKLPLNDKGLIPISFDNFSNRKDAVVALRQLQASENKDAWIFVLE